MSDLLSVDRTLFTIIGYPMSAIELAATVTCLWSVWLVTKRNMLTWPVGLVSVLLFMSLFYQVRLYSDALEQVYYLGASVYGWWAWSRSRPGPASAVEVHLSSRRTLVGWALVTAAASLVLGCVMTRIHVWMPRLFPEPAWQPYLDAVTTVMSLVAMWLMAQRRVESWVYWITVDVIAIGLYFAKGIKFVSLLYVVLLMLATRGFIEWRRAETEARPVPPSPMPAG